MIHTLISKNNRFKGNLHCHTTLSDGRHSPEKIAEAYREHGYSFLALTDHERYIEHPELQREDFVILNGVELSIDGMKNENTGASPCYHVNFYAKTPEHHDLQLPPKPDYYDRGKVNQYIAHIKSQGFLCSYNHPFWSLQNFEDYAPLEGVNFLEVYNHGCYISDGLHENQINVYDDMLRWGHSFPLYCIMTDDNHNGEPLDSLYSDSFGGYVMADAEELTYESIAGALEKGRFYASNGPVIQEMTFDPETLTVRIKTENAVSITLGTAGRRGYRLEAPQGQTVSEAVFHIRETDRYFRAEVTDTAAKRANSIAYYLKDFA